MNAHDRELGLGRDITRRDFLNGVAVALTGSLGFAITRRLGVGRARAQQPGTADRALEDYPPARTGMRGSHQGSFEAAHQLRDGDGAAPPPIR